MDTRRRQFAITLILVTTLTVVTSGWSQSRPEWSGTGKIRLIVEVPPVELKDRETDVLVASFPVDFDKILAERGVRGSVDLSRRHSQWT